ncbi:MAG: hypothetical protein RJA70_99 [Pseudomonadota bacterium]|jgi:uncharacterized membrane protein
MTENPKDTKLAPVVTPKGPKLAAATRWNLSELVTGTVMLALAGSSTGMFFSTLGVPLAAYLQTNTLESRDRVKLLIAIAVGAMLPVIATGVALVWKRRQAQPWIARAAKLLGPFVVLGPLPALVHYRFWNQKPLPFLVALLLLGLWLERLLPPALLELPRLHLRLTRLTPLRLKLERWLPLGVVVTAAVGYAAYTFYFSLQQHRRLLTSAYDLGIYDNLMYSTTQGKLFHSTVLLGTKGGSYLVGHAEFIMLLFAPLYALWAGPQFLLLLQATALGAAALPLYGLGSRLISRGAGAVLALCYLLYAPLHGSSFYDFHWLPLAIFVNFSLIYSIVTNKHWLTAVCLLLAVSIREDVSVGLVFLGLFLTLSNIRPKLGLAISVVSVCAFVGIRFVVMTLAGSFYLPNLYYSGLIIQGENGFGSIIKTVITNPTYFLESLLKEEKVIYGLHVFGTLLLWPLRSYRLAILCAGGFFFTFLTTNYDPTVSIRFQYSAHWISYIFPALTFGLAELSRKQHGTLRRNSTLFVVAGCVLLHSYVFGAILQRHTYTGGFYRVAFAMSESEKRQFNDVTELAKQIPQTASVAATERLVPHVSTRVTIYTLRSEHGDSEYLLVDRKEVQAAQRHILRSIVDGGKYKLVDRRSDFFLFSRIAGEQDPTSAFRALGLSPRGAT